MHFLRVETRMEGGGKLMPLLSLEEPAAWLVGV